MDCNGERVRDGFANTVAVERQGEERRRGEVVCRTLWKKLECHDSTEAVALAEVAAPVLERLVAELLSAPAPIPWTPPM